MKNIKFITDVEVNDCHKGTAKATRFKEGQTVTLDGTSARHWIDRNKAVEVEAKPKRARTTAADKRPTPENAEISSD